MKKTILLAATLMMGAGMASAQYVKDAGLFDNVSVGFDGGVTTPLYKAPFFKSMRPVVGMHIGKQLTPVFGAGVEGQFAINTTQSPTAFDQSYVGVYGSADLFNMLGGYQCETRPFTIDAVVGAGWGHDYVKGPGDYNFFATKAGLDFVFNVCNNLSIDIQPSVIWNMNNTGVAQTGAAYNVKNARFNLLAGVTYNFGPGFECVQPYNQAEIDALNGKINDLRSQLDGALDNSAAWEGRANSLAEQLAQAQSRPVETITEIQTVENNYLNSVRYVFFKIGSSVITPDQMPNVEMIAAYLKNHPGSSVEIKGYASQDGPEDVNVRLANNRAQAVKDALIKKYGIKADRIQAEGQGIGHMFSEESWNRVSICTIEDAE